MRTYDEEATLDFTLPLDVLALFKKDWLISETKTYAPPLFYSKEKRFDAIKESMGHLPALLRTLLEFGSLQYRNEQLLRKCCDALCCFPWLSIQSYLYVILLLLEELITLQPNAQIISLVSPSFRPEESLSQSLFTLHRILLYSLQCILRDFSDELIQCNILNILFKHLIDCNGWYNNQTNRLVDVETNQNGWTASMFTRLSSSANHALAFVVCIEIQEKKPEVGKMIEDVTIKKEKLVYLPALISALQPYINYQPNLREKHDDDTHNRYRFVSLLQCLVICFQSVREEYLEVVMNTCYSHLIVLLMNETDELPVSLSLSVCFV